MTATKILTMTQHERHDLGRAREAGIAGTPTRGLIHSRAGCCTGALDAGALQPVQPWY